MQTCIITYMPYIITCYNMLYTQSLKPRNKQRYATYGSSVSFVLPHFCVLLFGQPRTAETQFIQTFHHR